jgi:Spy/CpxP family protein refolding chaperone
MKYIVMAALLMAGVAAHAQEPLKQQGAKAPVERLTPAQKADKLTATLGLTADQQVKVKAAYEEQEKMTNESKDKYKEKRDPESRKAWVQDIKATRDQFKASMKEALTPEQYKKWQALKTLKPTEAPKKAAKDDGRLNSGALSNEN